MKVILLEKVDGLGQIGDIVEVKSGYARNYLLPKELALEASEASLKEAQRRQKRQDAAKQKAKEEAGSLADRLASTSCTITMPAGDDEKLFGSVTAQDIAEALKQENIIVDKRDVVIPQVINRLGIYNVQIKLHPEVTQELKVWVIKK